SNSGKIVLTLDKKIGDEQHENWHHRLLLLHQVGQCVVCTFFIKWVGKGACFLKKDSNSFQG
ncbi:hypothetical protein, partial [Moorena sp. SIO2C4]|uniref:hypothetical protein n=1 Tax=Moorena sp. SIO2C4 TaxID=2607824 RepID=UPI0025802BFE